jgi:hypothetical protein
VLEVQQERDQQLQELELPEQALELEQEAQRAQG